MPSKNSKILWETKNGEQEADKKENSIYAMFLHIVNLIPFVGWIIMLAMWMARHDKSPLVRQHGAALINLWLSLLTYFFLALVFGLIFFYLSILAGDGIEGRSPLNLIVDKSPILAIFCIKIYIIILIISLFKNISRAIKGQSARYAGTISMVSMDLDYPRQNSLHDHLID